MKKGLLLDVWKNLVLFSEKHFLQEKRQRGQMFAFCCLGSSMLQLLFRVQGKGMRSWSFHTCQMWLIHLLGLLLHLHLGPHTWCVTHKGKSLCQMLRCCHLTVLRYVCPLGRAQTRFNWGNYSSEQTCSVWPWFCSLLYRKVAIQCNMALSVTACHATYNMKNYLLF